MYASSAVATSTGQQQKQTHTHTHTNKKSTKNKSNKSHKPFQRLLYTSRHNSNIEQTLSTDKQFECSHLWVSAIALLQIKYNT